MLLDICRRQWNALRRTDHFRREGVSNLSHDLRSPLTATVACLETLDGRWAGERRAPTTAAWSRSRCATRATPPAWCSRSATWPSSTSPSSACAREAVDAGELLDDIVAALRRAGGAPGRRAAQRAGAPKARARRRAPRIDVELFERAVANLRRQRAQVLPARQHGDARARRRATAASRSASPTTGRASPPPTCRSCSTASTRAGRRSRRRPAKAAAASAWRSSSASPSCTAATSRSRARLGRGTRVVLTLPAARTASRRGRAHRGETLVPRFGAVLQWRDSAQAPAGAASAGGQTRRQPSREPGRGPKRNTKSGAYRADAELRLRGTGRPVAPVVVSMPLGGARQTPRRRRPRRRQNGNCAGAGYPHPAATARRAALATMRVGSALAHSGS